MKARGNQSLSLNPSLAVSKFKRLSKGTVEELQVVKDKKNESGNVFLIQGLGNSQTLSRVKANFN